ncbi:unnamed protein product [Lampetra fluviatilis]
MWTSDRGGGTQASGDEVIPPAAKGRRECGKGSHSPRPTAPSSACTARRVKAKSAMAETASPPHLSRRDPRLTISGQRPNRNRPRGLHRHLTPQPSARSRTPTPRQSEWAGARRTGPNDPRRPTRIVILHGELRQRRRFKNVNSESAEALGPPATHPDSSLGEQAASPPSAARRARPPPLPPQPLPPPPRPPGTALTEVKLWSGRPHQGRLWGGRRDPERGSVSNSARGDAGGGGARAPLS